MKLLSRSDLIQMLEEQQDFMLLKVRSTTAFRQTQIPSFQNVPVAKLDFVGQAESLLRGKGKHYPIVTCCAGFQCGASKDAASLFIEAGYTNVSAFEG